MGYGAKTILVTGATAGIGRFTALHLARRGHRVLASGRNAAALASLRAEAHDLPLETLPLDVTDAASIASARAHVDERTGGRGLDVLVNNAGFGIVGPTELMSDDDVRAQYETNVFGLLAVTRAFLPAMRARGRGRIINVSSLGGRHTLPLYGVYNSTKFAVESLSDALRIELGAFGVDVVLIEPGAVATEFTPRSLDGGAKYRRDDSPYAPVLSRYRELERMATRTSVGPATVARAIERAATARRPRARYVVPRAAGLLVGLLRALPTRWADQLARLALGLTRRRLAARSAAIAALTALVVLAPAAARADGWHFVKQADGIVVERRAVDGSSLQEFRGRGVVAAPAAAILAVFADVPRATEWMDSCNGSRVVEDLGAREKIVYNRTHAPWPVADRDAVLHNVVRVRPDERRVDLEFWSVSDGKAPVVDGVVRMPFLRGHWTLWASPDGATTRVEYQVHANPGGRLPDWLVNYASRELPFRTIEGLRAQVRRRQYPDFVAELRRQLAEYPFLWQHDASNL